MNPRKLHKPCKSRGDCYHVRGGSSKSPKKLAQLERLHETWSNSPENRAHLERLNNSSEHIAHLKRLYETWVTSPENRARFARAGKMLANSPEGKANLACARKRAQEVWVNSPEHKAHLARVREIHNNPSNEEVERLHKNLPGWNFNVHIDPRDGGNKIEVDAFQGKVCVFYDGMGKYVLGSKKNPNLRDEKRAFEEKQRKRLTTAGYTVRAIFNRLPSEVEILQWNLLAERHKNPDRRLYILPEPYRLESKMYKIYVDTGERVWNTNGLVFDTPEKAREYGNDLFSRWMTVRKFEVVQVPRADFAEYLTIEQVEQMKVAT